MDKKTFAIDIVNELNKNSDRIFYTTEVTKNNGLMLIGISAITSESIHPVIYVDDLYVKYLNNEVSFEECVNSIENSYYIAVNSAPGINAENLYDYNNVKDKLIIKVVNRDKNIELMLESPYIPITKDLIGLIYVDVMRTDDGMTGSFRVKNDILTPWNIDEQTLIKDATAATLKRYRDNEYILESLDALLGMPDSSPFWVIHSEDFRFGANVLAVNEILDDVCNKLDADQIVILPSSINEILVADMYDMIDTPIEFLTGIIRSVNSTVKEDEILSDHPYIYSKFGDLKCAD